MKDLTVYLGAQTAADVAAWAELTDRVVRVPAAQSRPCGHTPARLAKVFITDPVLGTQAIILKVLPPGSDAEAAAHRRAAREAPPPFRKHFVRQVFDSVRLADGSTLTFQAPAGHSDDWRPLSELPTSTIPAAYEALTRSLITDWNPDLVVLPADAAEALRADLWDDASMRDPWRDVVSADTAWIRVDGDLVPNPLHAVGPDSPFSGKQVDLAVGRIHGDLHSKNVLMRQRHGVVDWETFIMVDLMTYNSTGQIGRDIVRLLLSAAVPFLSGHTDHDRQLLLPVFVHPELAMRSDDQPMAVATLLAIYEAARTCLRPCGDDVWRAQYLLSLLGQGLAMSSFTNVGPELRWWAFRLSAHAARELFIEFGLSPERPTHAPALTNPFPVDATALDHPRPRSLDSIGARRGKLLAVKGF